MLSIVDTAGCGKTGRVRSGAVELVSVRCQVAIGDADVVALVIDANEATRSDAAIGDRPIAPGGAVIIANK